MQKKLGGKKKKQKRNKGKKAGYGASEPNDKAVML